MLLSLRTLGIKPDVRRLFVHDNRMFAERAFYSIVYRKIFRGYNKHDI